VEYYGTPVSLKSIAQISTPDASSLLVQPYDKSRYIMHFYMAHQRVEIDNKHQTDLIQAYYCTIPFYFMYGILVMVHMSYFVCSLP